MDKQGQGRGLCHPHDCAGDWVIYRHHSRGHGRQMELIKPPVPARDIYYNAGAILPLSIPALASAWAKEKLPGGGWSISPQASSWPCAPTEMQKPLEQEQRGALASRVFFSGSFFLLLEPLTKISGEIRQRFGVLFPGWARRGDPRPLLQLSLR